MALSWQHVAGLVRQTFQCRYIFSAGALLWAVELVFRAAQPPANRFSVSIFRGPPFSSPSPSRHPLYRARFLLSPRKSPIDSANTRRKRFNFPNLLTLRAGNFDKFPTSRGRKKRIAIKLKFRWNSNLFLLILYGRTKIVNTVDGELR